MPGKERGKEEKGKRQAARGESGERGGFGKYLFFWYFCRLRNTETNQI